MRYGLVRLSRASTAYPPVPSDVVLLVNFGSLPRCRRRAIVKAPMAKTRRAARADLRNSLWKYRKRMGFTQREVAAVLAHVSPTYLSHLERGDKLPSLMTALRLEILYRVPVAFLFAEHYARLKAAIREKEERLRIRGGGYDAAS